MLNRHFVTQMDINSDIYSKWFTVIQSRSQMALKQRFTQRCFEDYSGFVKGSLKVTQGLQFEVQLASITL